MTNIYDLLSEIGVEIPEDKKESFNKKLSENYKTVNEVESLRNKLTTAEADRDTYKNKYDTDIAQRDTDLADLKAKLEDAGQSKDKLSSLQTNLSELQNKYDSDKATWEKQLADQQYSFSLKEQARDLKFSSRAAQKVFIDELTANPLQVKDGNILGFADYVNAYKESNPDSFLADEGNNGDDGKKPPYFSAKSGKKENDGDNNDHQEQKPVPVIW